MRPTSKILLPLDTETAEKAIAMAVLLRDEIAGLKVGLELIHVAGVEIFARLREAVGEDVNIFYDGKFHDIPNTVAGAARAIACWKPWMFTIHASGGKEMMRAAVEASQQAAEAAGVRRPLIVAVTVLTSIDANVLHDQLGVTIKTLPDQVLTLAQLAKEAGCDGVIASPLEIESLRRACGPEFLIVTPGVRPAGSDIGDQKRVMTPVEAISAGADYLVIGRPITAAPDPAQAARAINAELGTLAPADSSGR